MINYALFILFSVIYCALHTSSVMNYNFLGSSLPTSSNIGFFIMFSMLNGWCRGVEGGVGVCGGHGGGDGEDGWGITGIPWLTIYSTLHSVLRIVPSLLLSKDPNSRLYLELDSPFLLKGFLLRIVPNINLMEKPIFHTTTSLSKFSNILSTYLFVLWRIYALLHHSWSLY